MDWYRFFYQVGCQGISMRDAMGLTQRVNLRDLSRLSPQMKQGDRVLPLMGDSITLLKFLTPHSSLLITLNYLNQLIAKLLKLDLTDAIDI